MKECSTLKRGLQRFERWQYEPRARGFRSLLGMCNVFRDSCTMLGPAVISLSRLPDKRGKGTANRDEWCPEHLEAIEAAKNVIATTKLYLELRPADLSPA